VDQAIESTNINIQWMEENYKTIAAWLEKAIEVQQASSGNEEL
jgi:hypothetical protein